MRGTKCSCCSGAARRTQVPLIQHLAGRVPAGPQKTQLNSACHHLPSPQPQLQPTNPGSPVPAPCSQQLPSHRIELASEPVLQLLQVLHSLKGGMHGQQVSSDGRCSHALRARLNPGKYLLQVILHILGCHNGITAGRANNGSAAAARGL